MSSPNPLRRRRRAGYANAPSWCSNLTGIHNRAMHDKPSSPIKAHKHIVDVLIEERAPHLVSGPFWPVLGPMLRALLGYRKARAMADAIAPLTGAAALDHISNVLRLNVCSHGLDRIPHYGRCIIVANHPTGVADGIAMYDAVHPIRPDLCFLANADAHRICAGLIDVLIPVVWPARKRTLQSTKLTLRMAQEALHDERAIVIFAAGAIARRVGGVTRDPEWEHSAVGLARKHSVPVIPTHLSGPFPFLFHLFDRVSSELRDITFLHELLNKIESNYGLIFGPPVDVSAHDGSNAVLTNRLKDYVEQVLPASPDAPFG